MTPTADIAGTGDRLGFDSAFLQKLERLSLMSRRPQEGPSAGPRPSNLHGSSVEFSDFRDYRPGDDFRRIDWNAYARLDRVFVRLYRAEQMTTVSIFIDHSLSMAFGTPHKSYAAAQLAAIFSYVALHSYDRLEIVSWGDRIHRRLPYQSGRRAVPAVWQFIAETIGTQSGQTEFKTLAQFARQRRSPGLAVVLSDFLTPTDWRGGLRALRSAGQEVTAVQILATEEIAPKIRGDWALRDSESGALVEVTISPRVLRRYEEELAAHTASIREYCVRQDINFVQIPSESSLTDHVLQSLHSARILV